MVRLITLAFFCFLVSVFAVSQALVKEKTFTLTKVKECFEEQKTKCGDLICEMSTDDLFYVVEQLESNVMDCLQK